MSRPELILSEELEAVSPCVAESVLCEQQRNFSSRHRRNAVDTSLRATSLAEKMVPDTCESCISLQRKYEIEVDKNSTQKFELMVYEQTCQQLKSEIEILKMKQTKYEALLQDQANALKEFEDRYQQLRCNLDRDGDLPTACELASRRADLVLQGNYSLSLRELAKRNGDAQLITAVTTYNLLVEVQKHINDGSLYSEFKQSLNLCKQTENELSKFQERIELYVRTKFQKDRASDEPQPAAIIAAENDEMEAFGESYPCTRSESDSEFAAGKELAVNGGNASAAAEVVVVTAASIATTSESQQEHNGRAGDLDVIQTNILTHGTLVVPGIVTPSLDQMVNERNVHRAELIQHARHLCSQFPNIETLLQQRLEKSSGLLCKLDGHLPDSPCSFSSLCNEKSTEGTVSKAELVSVTEHDSEEHEEYFSKKTPEVKQFAISNAILKVESWLSRMERLVSKAAHKREAAATKFAGTLQTIVDLLSRKDLATISSLKEAAKLDPAIGTHKYLEMAFLNETEVLKDKKLILTFPFNECMCALCDAKSLLDEESADLRMFRPEVEKLIDVVKDLEPWVLKGPGEVMENLEQLNQEHLLLMHSRDENASTIRDFKRRGKNIDTLVADQQQLVKRNAHCLENLNVSVEQALRITWHLFPENKNALTNLLQKIKVSMTGNDSEQDVILSNGLLKKKTIEMYGIEQSLVEIGARHRVLKCFMISNDETATQSVCVLKEFQTNISAYGTWACCQKSRTNSTKWWESFVKEVGVLSRARHPYIAQINCCFFCEIGDVPAAYIEMPYYEGGTLSKWMELNPSEHHVQRVLHQLLLGIQYLHINGVIHCDIKPDNILMKSFEMDSSPVLADFDVSVTFDKRSTTTAGRGSFIYMAPELKQNGKKSNLVTPKADIYSYGIVVFEICCPHEFHLRELFESPTTTLVQNRVLVSFIQELSHSDPLKRMSATAALQHEYFTDQTLLPNVHVASEFHRSREKFLKQLEALKGQLGKSIQAEKECSLKMIDKCNTYKRLKECELQLQELEGCKLTKANIAEREVLDKEHFDLNLELIKIKEDQESCKVQIQIVEKQQKDFEAGERRRENAELITSPPAHWRINTIKWINASLCKVDVTDEMKTNVEQLFQNSQELYPEFKGRGKYSVLSVNRLENPNLWKQYVLQRHWIGENSTKNLALREYGPKADWSETLTDKKANEVLLFHGTKQFSVNSIADMGFDERVFNFNGLFGAGIYFADSVDKSFLHCDKPALSANRSCYLFIARVVLGLPFEAQNPRNKERGAPPLPDEPCQFHNSVIGVTPQTHPGAHLKTFREFVVYDRHQAYPELLVEFIRLPS